jgi:predicted amidohydrolase YtcJ
MRCILIVATWLTLAIGTFGQPGDTFHPDEIFYNGKIITVDSTFRIQQAFAVKQERFVAVGSNAQVRALAGKSTRLIDLHGLTVIPGLIDGHNHQYNGAFMLLRGVDLIGVPSLAEMLDRLRQAIETTPAAATVFATAGWNEADFPEKRAPTRQELDQVSQDHPIIIFRSRGAAYLNSRALLAAGISRDTASIAGFPVPKDLSREPTGVVSGPAAVLSVAATLIPAPTEAEKEQLILKIQKQQHALGLTSIREPELSPEIMRVYWNLWRKGRLTMRVSMGLDVPPSDADKMEQILSPWGVGPGFGDHQLRIDGVGEFLVDVNIAAHSAYLREPYIDLPGNNIGVPRIPPDKFREAVLTMDRYDWRPAIHTYGDKALDLVLDGYEYADREKPIRDSRWVVEHVPLVHPDQMERMARLGVMVIANIQPYNGNEAMVRTLGRDRAEHAVPMRTMLDRHLVVGTGSDWPTFSNNPFTNIYFYVSRRTIDGKLAGAGEKISREEALKVATVNNAYITDEEAVKGSIEEGKFADFVVLSDDILTVPEEQIRSIRPVATYVGGREVYASKDGGF